MLQSVWKAHCCRGPAPVSRRPDSPGEKWWGGVTRDSSRRRCSVFSVEWMERMDRYECVCVDSDVNQTTLKHEILVLKNLCIHKSVSRR